MVTPYFSRSGVSRRSIPAVGCNIVHRGFVTEWCQIFLHDVCRGSLHLEHRRVRLML
ncbi:hypothetical protein Gbem_4150 [Citrifermentans bemidjiense Bem]|uniref:Uncharacterized protein n=1 Tax=Citrifermentans bemidjiense (strain ATCC BAA-1014 / DSM 16622 / JCM 12645 / Bem) TaxID=404380 RepID=E1P6B7_CITBB|nr:hypothetical protein Gbem_4150 [Citrifermentans bemidjiense Bem]